MSNYVTVAQQLADSKQLLHTSQQEEFPYKVEYQNMEFEVHRGVFSPKYFNGWRTFTEYFPQVYGKSVLEIGCGCGITSVVLANQGAFVTAFDINTLAVENTKTNATRNNLAVDVRVSDIYSALDSSEHFDYIYWNMPFVYVPENHNFSNALEQALVDPGYQLTKRFVHDGGNHLAPNGKLLVGTGSFGDVDLLEEIARQRGYSSKILVRENSVEINSVEFIFYELGRDF